MELHKEILKFIDYKKPGFFIEAGANDGITQSNTFLLEKEFGWKGLLIEPSKLAFENCKKIRTNSKVYNYCLVSEDYDSKCIFGDFDGNLMSSVQGDRLSRKQLNLVPATTLQSLLDVNFINHVDFFSLDTEGYELNVLKGIDFNRVSIKKILIEVYEKDKKEIFSFLKELGYSEPICITNFNKNDYPFWDGTHNDYLFQK